MTTSSLHDPRDPDDDRWSPWDGEPVHPETDGYDFTPTIDADEPGPVTP